MDCKMFKLIAIKIRPGRTKMRKHNKNCLLTDKLGQIRNFLTKSDPEKIISDPQHCIVLKGTGTRDLIWLKVVSFDRSWLLELTDNL